MRYFRLLFLVAFVLIGSYFSSHTVLISTAGLQRYWVNVATTEPMWEKGLMGQTNLAEDEGMLFVFPDQRKVTFWMKDTLIPLDIIFFNQQKQVVGIESNAQPCLEMVEQTCPTFSSHEPVKYVLELKAGETKAKQILVGSQAYWFPY